jgi:hypothetical protein
MFLRNGKSAGVDGAEDQAGEFDGLVDGCDDFWRVRDGFAAEAGGRDEGCGDEERALQAVVRVWRLGHEATIVASSLCVRLAKLAWRSFRNFSASVA